MPKTNVQKWLDALDKQRRKLKMSLPILAERAHLSRATVCRILKEKRTTSSLESVLAVANALGAEAKLRIQDPEKFVEQQVQKRARKIVRMVQGTMALEGQGITDPNHLGQLVETAAQEIRAKPRKQLWARQCRSSIPSQTKLPSPMSPN